MPALRTSLVAVGALAALGVVAAAALAFLAFGVPAVAPASDPSPDTATIASSRASVEAPAAFRDRTPFRSCGEVALAQGSPIPLARIRCLAATPVEGRASPASNPLVHRQSVTN